MCVNTLLGATNSILSVQFAISAGFVCGKLVVYHLLRLHVNITQGLQVIIIYTFGIKMGWRCIH